MQALAPIQTSQHKIYTIEIHGNKILKTSLGPAKGNIIISEMHKDEVT